MTDFNFNALTDIDFERLVNDIIEHKYKHRVETFKKGRDQGIDGRFEYGKGKVAVIQSKHYLKSGFKALLRHCISVEYEKVKKLNPDRYIFACSTGLSPADKKKLKAAFGPYIKRYSYIYGADEINELLQRQDHIDIVKKNYKLWITSTNVLSLITHNGIYQKSRYKLEDIVEKCRIYVHTKNHEKAINKLSKTHCLITIGEPGIGKSTLSEQVCNQLVSENYKFYEVNTPDEVWDVISEDEKQVFYYDDFLGSNCLEALDNNKDGKITKLINTVKKSDNKRLILTSRTSILNHGKDESLSFKKHNIDHNSIVLSINDITKIEKAEILYNHIFFSSLPEDLAQEFFTNKNYKHVISHENYNPRLIEFITSANNTENLTKDEYWPFVTFNLDNPSEVWEHAIEKQLENQERKILYFVAIKNRDISENHLKEAFEDFANIEKTAQTDTPFNKSIKILTGSFLTRKNSDGDVTFSLANPSIADYIFPKLLRENTITSDLVDTLHPKHISTANIKSLLSYTNIDNTSKERTIEKLIEIELEKNTLSDLYLFLLKKLEMTNSNSKTYHKAKERFIGELKNGNHTIFNSDSIDILHLLSFSNDIHNKIDYDKTVLDAITSTHDHHDLITISDIIYENQDKFTNIEAVEEEFNSQVISIWESEFDSHLEDSLDITVDVHKDFDKEETLDEIEDQAESLADDIINSYSITISATSSDLTIYTDMGSFIDNVKDEYDYLKSLESDEDDDVNTAKDDDDDDDEWEDVDSMFSKGLSV